MLEWPATRQPAELVPLHPALAVGGPLGIGVVDEQHELTAPMRCGIRAVVPIDVDPGHDAGVLESEPPLVAIPLVETDRLAGLEAGCAVLVRAPVRGLWAHVAALRIFHDDLVDLVGLVVVERAEHAGES